MIGVSYSADLKKTKEVIARVLESDLRVPKTLAPTIGVVALAD